MEYAGNNLLNARSSNYACLFSIWSGICSL